MAQVVKEMGVYVISHIGYGKNFLTLYKYGPLLV